MARVQLVMADSEKDSFVMQARREGMSLSAWLRTAARERLKERQGDRMFRSLEELREFFRYCDTLEGPEPEPDWEEHLRTMARSRMSGLSGL